MSDSTKKIIDSLFDELSQFDWPDLEKTKNGIIVNRKDKINLLELKRGRFTLLFVWYNVDIEEYVIKSGLNKIRFDKNIDPLNIIYFRRTSYDLSRNSQVKSLLQLKSGEVYHNKIKTIDVSKKHKRISFSEREKIVKIPSKKYFNILKDIHEACNKARGYGNSAQRYLINKLIKKHLGKDIQHKTNTEKGEFSFLVHRLNLSTKKTLDDFKKYLDKTDIQSLEALFDTLIKKEVFSPEFFRRLDEYFIKEKLESIIKLGHEILSLKTPNLNTVAAERVIDKIGDKRISQLETIWQRYFEKNLLYLIFSYKKIYPKIKLELDTEKKYPDFIGINHYNGVDAIEIKTHLTQALTWDPNHKNFSFSPDFSKAIIQTMNYMDAIKRERFKEDRDREKITEITNKENLYRPRGIIVISSKDKLIPNIDKYDRGKIDRDFTKLRNSLHNIEILTFDEIIEIADTYTSNIVKEWKEND